MSANPVYLWHPASFDEPAAATPTSLQAALDFADQWLERAAPKPQAQQAVLTRLGRKLAAEAQQPHYCDAFGPLYSQVDAHMATQLQRAVIDFPCGQGRGYAEAQAWLAPFCAQHGLVLLDKNANVVLLPSPPGKPQRILPPEAAAPLRDALADVAAELEQAREAIAQELAAEAAERQNAEARTGLLGTLAQRAGQAQASVRARITSLMDASTPFPTQLRAFAKVVLAELQPYLQDLGYTLERNDRDGHRWLFMRDELYGHQIVELWLDPGKWGYTINTSLYFHAPRLWEPNRQFFSALADCHRTGLVDSVLRTPWGKEPGEVGQPNAYTGEHINTWTVCQGSRDTEIMHLNDWMVLRRALAHFKRRLSAYSRVRSYAALYECGLGAGGKVERFADHFWRGNHPVLTLSDDPYINACRVPHWLMLARLGGEPDVRQLAARMLDESTRAVRDLPEREQAPFPLLQAALPAYLDHLEALDVQAHGQVNPIQPKPSPKSSDSAPPPPPYPASAFEVPLYVWSCYDLMSEQEQDLRGGNEAEQAAYQAAFTRVTPRTAQEAEALFQRWRTRTIRGRWTAGLIASALWKRCFDDRASDAYARFYDALPEEFDRQACRLRSPIRQVPVTAALLDEALAEMHSFGRNITDTVVRVGEPPVYYLAGEKLE